MRTPLALLALLACGLAAAQDLVVIPLKPDPPIAVDGNLDEWAGVPNALEVRGKEHATHNATTWIGPDDLGATLHLAWRQEGLYLAAEVTDDVVLQQQRDEKLYQGDHIEWFIDLAPDAEPGRGTFGKGQFQLAFSPGNFKRTGDLLVDIKPEVYCYQPKGLDVSSVKFAAVQTPRGWTMEALAPFALLGLSGPAANVPLSVQVAISDCDSTEPAQETYMTVSTTPWVYSRKSLMAAVLGDVAGKGAPPPQAIVLRPALQIKAGGAEELTFPAPIVPAGKEAFLFLKARVISPKVAGYTFALRTSVNGTVLGADRVTNKPITVALRSGRQHNFITPDGTTYVPYAPDFEAYDKHEQYGPVESIKTQEWEFRIGDLLKPGDNTLLLKSLTDPASTRDLEIVDLQLRLKTPPPPAVAKRPAPTGPLPVYEPRPPASHDWHTEMTESTVAWTLGPERFVCESRFSTPNGQWVTGSNKYFDHSREVEPRGEWILVKDTFRNRTNEPLPLMQRHTVNLQGKVKRAWCAGISPASGNITMMEPANPTSFAVTGKSGVGLLPLNDEFQVHVMNSALDGVLGLADNTYVLKPGGTYTAEWAIVPTDRPDFWDFVNACRRLRNVNFPLTQMFAFLSAKPDVEQWSDEKLVQFIRNKSANVVCASIDYPRYKGNYAHGTVFQALDLSNYARHNERVRRLCPEVKTQVYFHCYIDVGDESPTKYADARTLLANGEQANYGKPADRIFLPTLDNQFGRDIGKNIDAIFDVCKADGVYWDELAYSAYKYHYGEPWDGCSGDIDPQTGKLVRKKTSVTLASQPFLVYNMKRIMARGPLMANGAPHTRTMADLHYQTFVETASISNCLRAVLYSPVALGDHISERKEIDAYRWMTSALDFGCLYSWYAASVWADTPTLTQHMFPTTPVELHEGFIIGQERIVTNRSGLFGWGDQSAHEVHVFNDEGREVPDFKAPTVTQDGKTYTELRIAEGWTAAIVRK
ncbi:hypothetical protein LLH23_17900 [bacterium]|nr:hypothetical protein [bacterium]